MKKAFTLAEFILCITIMFTIMGAMITVPLKKAKQTNATQKKSDTIACSCSDPEVIDKGYECEFEIDNGNGRYEFYELQLLGGGAAGGDVKGGAAGEAKIITYPLLRSGKYLIRLGEGGQKPNINGGNTILYRITEENNYEIIEFARGGIGSNEKVDESKIIETDPTKIAEEKEKLKIGEISSFSGNDSICGSGGDAGKNGQYGEAIIKW